MAILLDMDNDFPLEDEEKQRMMHYGIVLIEQIWWIKNRIRIGEDARDWTVFASNVLRLSKQYWEAGVKRKTNRSKHHNVDTWNPPQLGNYKFNFDVALADNCAISAIVFRNHDGIVLGAWTNRFFSCNFFCAEMDAVVQAFDIAEDMKIREVDFEDMTGHQTSNAERGLRESFASFYEGWFTKHKEFQEKLLECWREDEECNEIVTRVLAHYEEFFHEKSKAAIEDVFLVISPPWLTSFERTLVWISAFKPSLVFPLIKNSVGEELSPNQSAKIEQIKADVGKKEKDLEKELARVQEGVAGDGVLNLVRRFETLVDCEISELDTAMEDLKAVMLMVVENADALRGTTVKKVMKVLEPSQNVKFLAAVGQFLVRARRWGSYRDSQAASAASA